MDIRQRTIGHSGIGLFTNVNIPAGSSIAVHEHKQSERTIFVESGMLSFANHGCQGSYNLIAPVDIETNADDLATMSEWHVFTENIEYLFGNRVNTISGYGYNSVVDYHLVVFDNRKEVTRRNVKAGEEMYSNYLPYAHSTTIY